VRAGATLIAGGTRDGAFMAPTILADVPLDERLFCEETFGPVVPIVAFDSLDEAIGIANDSPYGLQAAVFTRDLQTAMNVAFRLEAGGVIVNWGSAVRSENLPFGGLKMSGHGREAIHDTMLSMTEQKAILFHDVLAVGSQGTGSRQ
jgi:lactaldehyde dehydrogenase